jgi:radical SAM superfamily enzyme YgiQ (UPF0313 family)
MASLRDLSQESLPSMPVVVAGSAQCGRSIGCIHYFLCLRRRAEDTEFLDAMQAAHIKGALVGVESVTPEGLKDVYKEFNCAGEDLVQRLRTFRRHGIYVLGSFIFGLPSDRPETFDATATLAAQAEIAFAQFVMITPYPGTVDFKRWEKMMEASSVTIGGFSLLGVG